MAYVLYAAAYVLVTVLLGPAWLMTIAAGLFFGLLPGAAVVWVGRDCSGPPPRS